MKFQRAVIFVTFLGVMASGISSQDTQESDEVGETKAKNYCGRVLARTLAMLCPRGLLIKRSEPVYNYLLTHGGQEYGWPWVARHRARSMERGKRQAASECCDQPCTIDELLEYCAPV